MDKDKKSSNGGGMKNRFTQMLLRSACTTDTADSSTSFITISKNGTSGTNIEPPGTPSLFDLLNKHRYEKKTATNSRPKLEKNVSARTAPVVQISIDCTGRRSLHGTNKNFVPVFVPAKEEEKKKSNGNNNSRKISPVSSSSPSTKFYNSNHETRRQKNATKPKRRERKKLHSNGYGFSTSSSAHSDMEAGLLFSSEGEGETHTLFSSKSFSSDSSEFYRHTNKLKTRINSKHSPNKPVKKSVPIPKDNTKKETEPNKPLHSLCSKETERNKPLHSVSSKETESKKPLHSVSSKEKKASETGIGTGTGTGTGTAVVKKSSDPYMDFRSSMVEMILEEKVVCVEEMEKLLKSYLALNVERHHPIIVRAFEDICEAIFHNE